MNVKVEYTNRAIKELKKIDVVQARKIIKKLGTVRHSEDTFLTKAKKLKSPYDSSCRYRMGDYRVVFNIDDNSNLIILTILRVKHRKDVYR